MILWKPVNVMSSVTEQTVLGLRNRTSKTQIIKFHSTLCRNFTQIKNIWFANLPNFIHHLFYSPRSDVAHGDRRHQEPGDQQRSPLPEQLSGEQHRTLHFPQEGEERRQREEEEVDQGRHRHTQQLPVSRRTDVIGSFYSYDRQRNEAKETWFSFILVDQTLAYI